MNLVSGKVYWPETIREAPRYSCLGENTSCDVVVIGAGEAGAMISYELIQAGVDTIVVDKRRVGSGSTCANTGLLQFNNDKTLTSCINSFGIDRAVRFYKMCEEGIGKIEELADQCSITPDFRQRDSLYFASCQKDAASLLEEYNTLVKYGFPVTFLEEREVGERFSFHKPAALYTTKDADINPYKLALGLINAASKQGLRVYENTEVVHHVNRGPKVDVVVAGDYVITASFVVFATGYETQQIKRNPNAVLESTFAIATNPITEKPGWYNECLIWETARPYLYMRTTVDGRIMAGGYDERSVDAEMRDKMLIGKRDRLVRDIDTMFPEIGVVDAPYYWSATFGSTHDGLPLIGPQPEFPRAFFALGYGGNGVVYCTIAASLIRDFVTNGSHPTAPLFAFNR
ncbi:NAD(P)/FAD-dependent oxidoreductase [Pontibacillus salicampi]|uniref:NAD(P)/FAD-dependent oxidoreductase n=1 Tax=Pontibacillus salicampi TaxID=1449801 RepID=A0ABV6LRY6_9BACI